jgi:hypothetical protein
MNSSQPLNANKEHGSDFGVRWQVPNAGRDTAFERAQNCRVIPRSKAVSPMPDWRLASLPQQSKSLIAIHC